MHRLRPLSMIAQTAWQDLLRLLREGEMSDTRGTPKLKHAGGKAYWFDQYRVGAKVVERYIGEDSADLRARMEQARDKAADRKTREARQMRLARILTAEGLLRPDLATGQMLMAMARAGTFRLGGTVVGTQAFRHYEGLLGVHLDADFAASTDDVDIASFERLSVVLDTLGDRAEPQMPGLLGELEFDPVPATDPGRTWRWRQSNQGTLVEFLTPSFEADEGLRDLPTLGVSAQSLHFLNFLIADAVEVPLLYRSGALIRVPRPERFAVHKLIVSERRLGGPDAGKSRKDRMQAELLIGHLAAEDPLALVEALDDARGRGRTWERLIDKALARLPAARSAMEEARASV